MKYRKFLYAVFFIFGVVGCKETINEANLENLKYDIAFTSNRDGNDEIYVMNVYGRNQTRLTNNNVRDWFPKWSPDGQKIAYLSQAEGKNQLFLMDKDGSNKKQITTGINIDDGHQWLEWSNDGKQILTQVRTDRNITQIYIVNSDGSDQRFLTVGYYPNWIGDNKIIFGGEGICLINSDGSGLIHLTDGSIPDFSPVVSTSLGKIIFRSFRDNDSGKASLHIMNLDGSAIIEVSKKDPIIKPTFSPDNSEILFVAPQTIFGPDNIFRVDINGNNEELLVNLGNIKSSPVYSSDGNKIIISASANDGSWDIYSKNLLNGNITNLTNQKGVFPINNYPDWNPVR